MRAHQFLERNIVLGVTAGVGKKVKPCMRWMDIKTVTGLSVNDTKQLMQEEEKVAFISIRHSEKEKRSDV